MSAQMSAQRSAESALTDQMVIGAVVKRHAVVLGLPPSKTWRLNADDSHDKPSASWRAERGGVQE